MADCVVSCLRVTNFVLSSGVDKPGSNCNVLIPFAVNMLQHKCKQPYQEFLKILSHLQSRTTNYAAVLFPYSKNRPFFWMTSSSLKKALQFKKTKFV